MKKKIILNILFLFFAVLICVITAIFSEKTGYIVPAAAICFLVVIYFFISAEMHTKSVMTLCLIATLVAISVSLRAVLYLVPHFKPVAAVVIIAAIYLGSENGFLCGALSALISNFIFGQGPWTPFQMLGWGIIGLFAGMASKVLRKSKIALCLYGVVSGIFYSVVMDISSLLWMADDFLLQKVIAIFISSLPTMLIYCVSNAVFLLLLNPVIGKKLDFVIKKYG